MFAAIAYRLRMLWEHVTGADLAAEAEREAELDGWAEGK